MNLDTLAFEIAVLSDADKAKLAELLVRDYTKSADVLETQLCNQFFEIGVTE
jgi:hypothetical protein